MLAGLDTHSPHGRELARQMGFSLASEKLDKHLSEAIEQFSPPKQEPRKMRGLARLANLTETIVKQMDDKADAVADRLVAAQARHEATLAKFEDFTSAVEKIADEAEASIGQISNLPPPSA
jgi:hypothetical protein